MRRPALALLFLVLTVGCDRTPRLVPPGGDSTAAIPADSTAAYVQMARERWDSPDQMEDAASLVARVLLDDLRAHAGEPLNGRARDFADSLLLGAEVVGGRELAIVNLFARADPTAGSWPWLFWRASGRTHAQSLEAQGMRLSGVSVESADASALLGGARVAVLFARAGAGGQQPFVFVWQRPPDATSWRLAQSLGADSLGAVGTARFVEPGSGGIALVSRTHRVAQGFDECASCPHVHRTRSFRWGPAGLVSVGEAVERTPYYSFIQFIHALVAGDFDLAGHWAADGSIVEAATGYEWGRSKGRWRLAPGTGPNARDLLFLRGTQEAYRVHFTSRGDDWVISGLEPSNRTIE